MFKMNVLNLFQHWNMGILLLIGSFWCTKIWNSIK